VTMPGAASSLPSAASGGGRFPWRRLLGPGLLTLAMLAVLIGLGTWQLDRLAWKTALLAEIDRAEQAPPVALPATPAPFAKVVVAGRLRPDLAALYGDEVRDIASGPAMGARLIEPLERPGAPPVLVDLGWVPEGGAHPGGAARIVGYVRPPERRGWLSAADDPKARRFYTLDPAAIGAALGLAEATPYVLVALQGGPDGPQPATALPRPANNHLQYALTWYGLAVTLAVIYGLWCRSVWRVAGKEGQGSALDPLGP